MDMPSLDPKCWLVNEISRQAEWYRQMASFILGDKRSAQCPRTLKRLASAVKALPETHPLFNLLEQIDRDVFRPHPI